jgi:hypothetical protein
LPSNWFNRKRPTEKSKGEGGRERKERKREIVKERESEY